MNRHELGETVTAIAGSSTPELNVSFSGCPQPTVKWLFNGSQLRYDERLTVQTNDSRSSLVVYNYRRSDTGVYTVVLENERGRDKIHINLLVIGELRRDYSCDSTTIRLRRIARACFHSTPFDTSKK